jgi:hypothetical protein
MTPTFPMLAPRPLPQGQVVATVPRQEWYVGGWVGPRAPGCGKWVSETPSQGDNPGGYRRRAFAWFCSKTLAHVPQSHQTPLTKPVQRWCGSGVQDGDYKTLISIFFFFFFCSRGFNSGLTPCATPPALFCYGYFRDRVSGTICRGWL